MFVLDFTETEIFNNSRSLQKEIPEKISISMRRLWSCSIAETRDTMGTTPKNSVFVVPETHFYKYPRVSDTFPTWKEIVLEWIGLDSEYADSSVWLSNAITSIVITNIDSKMWKEK